VPAAPVAKPGAQQRRSSALPAFQQLHCRLIAVRGCHQLICCAGEAAMRVSTRPSPGYPSA
jgi:hypothetical protein